MEERRTHPEGTVLDRDAPHGLLEERISPAQRHAAKVLMADDEPFQAMLRREHDEAEFRDLLDNPNA